MIRTKQDTLLVLAILLTTQYVTAQVLPDGFVRRGDVIYPVQWEKERQALRHPDSGGLRTTMKQLRGHASGIVICYQWTNRMADTINHTPQNYDEILFSTGTYPTGSLNDYFLENSYAKFSIDGDVTRWFTAPDTYNIDNQFSWMEQAVALADPEVDFSQYDADSNGYVDIAYLVHAGPAWEETRDPDDPISYAFPGWLIPTNDGVAINGFTHQPEGHADGSILGIAVTRHESGHLLFDFPDLYDYDDKYDTTTYYTPGDYNDHPVQDWCAMGYGGYGLFSYRYGPGPAEHPSHFCGLLKNWAAWIEPTVLDSSQPGVSIYCIEQHDSASLYKIPINGSVQEYFLIENRHTEQTGIFDHLDSDYSAFFEFFTPGPNALDAGLIITHVDEAMPFNNGTPGCDHYAAVIEDAGYNPAIPWDGTEFTEYWYPYECQVGAAFCREDGQFSFTPRTTPNTNGYTGYSGIWITNISNAGEMMTFDFYTEADPPVFADVYRWPDTNFTGPYAVHAVILDTFGIYTDSLYCAINNTGFIPVASDSVQGDTQYWYHIPYTASFGDSITYYVAATDNVPNRQTSGLYAFNVEETGIEEFTTDVGSRALPHLCQNEPNPFKESTLIQYRIMNSSFITLRIYNALGELVETLVNKTQDAGTYNILWYGKDTHGRNLPNGTYFLRLEAVGQSEARQMILLK